MPVSRGRRVLAGCALLLLLALGPPPSAIAQTITYEYDPLGRLSLVSTPEGVARYEYDAVGNLLRIVSRRADEVPGPVALLLLAPARGPVGSEVRLYGTGFGETPAANQVAFAGTPAAVTAASPTRLVVTVPPGAASGAVTVIAPAGSATSLEPFTVTRSLQVVPATADVVLGTAVGFQARQDGVPTPDVTWQVQGVAGGSALLGTITPAGVYTAPVTSPLVQPLTIQAALSADPSQTATATVRLVGQAAGLVEAAPLAVGVADAQPGQLVAPSVSVGPAAALAGQLLSGPLAVTAGPLVTGVNPASGAQGSAPALALTGANLQGATAVLLLRNGLVDGTVTAAGVTAAPDGSGLTCTLTLGATAPVGDRILQVVTPQGRSTAVDLGGNRFTVTAP